MSADKELATARFVECLGRIPDDVTPVIAGQIQPVTATVTIYEPSGAKEVGCSFVTQDGKCRRFVSGDAAPTCIHLHPVRQDQALILPDADVKGTRQTEQLVDSGTTLGKIIDFLQKCTIQGITTTYEEIAEATGVALGTVRNYAGPKSLIDRTAIMDGRKKKR